MPLVPVEYMMCEIRRLYIVGLYGSIRVAVKKSHYAYLFWLWRRDKMHRYKEHVCVHMYVFTRQFFMGGK